MSLKTGIFVVLLSLVVICEAQVNLANGLVGHWKFDGNPQDSSGRGHHGTVNGAVLTTDRCGRPRRAYLFNGNSSYINVSDHADLRPGHITISIWLIANALQSGAITGFPLYKSELNPPTSAPQSQRPRFEQYCLSYDSQAGFHVKRNSNGAALTGWQRARSNNVIRGKWEHLVGIWDGTNVRLYINGQQVASTGGPAGNIDNLPGGNLRFGTGWQSPGIMHWDGALDDIRIYNRALSAQEVLVLYDLEKCPSISNSAIPNGSCCTLRTAFKNGKIILQTSGVINRRGQFVSPGNSLKIVKGAPTRFSLRSYRSSPGRVRRGNTPLKRIPGLGPQGPLSRQP